MQWQPAHYYIFKMTPLTLSDSTYNFIFASCSIQSLSRVRLFATPWSLARQASLSITNSRSPPKVMSIESVMPSSHLILCHPLLLLPPILPALESFPMSQLFTWGAQSIGVSASASVLPMNTQDWFPLGWTGWISLQSKGLSRVFCYQLPNELSAPNYLSQGFLSRKSQLMEYALESDTF